MSHKSEQYLTNPQAQTALLILGVKHTYSPSPAVLLPPGKPPCDTVDNNWLELLHSFSAVKSLYLSKKLAPHLMLALRGLSMERAAEVLPALQNLFIEGFQPSRSVRGAIFIALRQLSNHPVNTHPWIRNVP